MPSSTRLLLTLGTLLLGFSASCGGSDNSVLLTLSSVPSRATQLVVTAMLDSKPLTDSAASPMPVTLPLSMNELGITVPTPGHLVLDVQAYDSDQCQQGSAHSEVDVIAGLTNLTAAISPLSLRKCGNLAPCAAGAACTGPSSGTTTSLRSIWTIAPNDIWAVGTSDTVLHYDGNSWTATPPASLPVPAATNWNGVWASASNDVWVVGSAGRIIHFDGTMWSLSTSGAQRTLEGISGLNSQSIWVVGDSSGSSTPGVFLHWNGSAWTQLTPFGNGDLYAVLAVTSSFILVGGDNSASGVLWVFDGMSKFKNYSADAPVPVYNFWASSPARAVAVGALAEILIFDGTAWNLTQNTINSDFKGITSDGTTTYIVGSNGYGFSSTDPTLANLTPIKNLPKANLWSVRPAKNGLVWLAGDNGYVSYLDSRP